MIYKVGQFNIYGICVFMQFLNVTCAAKIYKKENMKDFFDKVPIHVLGLNDLKKSGNKLEPSSSSHSTP